MQIKCISWILKYYHNKNKLIIRPGTKFDKKIFIFITEEFWICNSNLELFLEAIL